uniref:Ints3-like C-terminal domain-containing protein n=1 Tax=Hyaloperonospora arabidopsidis (strain Emoy2) TaxID=559515 RepID=M4B2J0_HYAAE
MLLSSAPELQSELHRIFPEHFPSAEVAKMTQAQASASSPVSSAGGSPSRSPGPASSPGRQSPIRHSPARESPVRGSPIGAASPLASPLRSQSPIHSDTSLGGSASSDANSLGALSFLPSNQHTMESTAELTTHGDTLTPTSPAPVISHIQPVIDVPESIAASELIDIKRFQQIMPEPCSRPSKSFLECLNDILLSWPRQDNAVELAASLGSFLHELLERIIVTSPIASSDLQDATPTSVFDSMLDQVLSEPLALYVPFLKAMYARDVTISYRLLVLCCSQGNGKSPDVALGPYAIFVDAIGGNLAQHIVKDLSLSQQIDDARAQACGFLDKPVSMSLSKGEMDAVSATSLLVCPFLFAHMEHPFLSKLEGRSEALVQLLLGLLTPALLHTLCTRVVMREFPIFNNRLANIMLSSLQWTSWEQYSMWDLVVAELQSGRSVAAETNMMAAARKVLACVDPKETPETMTGLLKCLIHFRPDVSVLQSVFNLSDTYDNFSLAVLTCWMDKFPDVMTSYVHSSLESANDSNFSKDSAVARLISKLDHLQEVRSRNFHSSGLESEVLAVLQDGSIVSMLKKKLLQRPIDTSPLADDYHTLRAFLVDDQPPYKKKLRLAEDDDYQA